MHSSSIFTILAAASLCAAAPTDNQGKGHITTVVSQLDSEGKITWTPAANGGRAAVISPDDVAAAEQVSGGAGTRMLATRGGPSAAVGAFTNLGQIYKNAASYACETGGQYGVSSTIETMASDACKSFLQQVPGAPLAETAWNVYQGANKPGPDGGQVSTIFRFFYNSPNAPKLEEKICTEAYKQLTSTFCQGKGDNGGNTKGGEIKIGTDDDYTMVGFDPNDV